MAVLPPTVPPQARLADLLLSEHGGLAAFLAAGRATEPQTSWDRIARNLFLRTNGQVDVTGPTIADWSQRIDSYVHHPAIVDDEAAS